MASGSELNLRQVVVALDAAADFAPAIELGGVVAAAWRAGLRGLFAEDERLQRLAALPFAQQLDPMTALRSPISPMVLRAEIAALAQRMRQEVKDVADRHGLSWSFEQMTTAIGRDALALDSDELLVVGLSSRPIASQMRLHSPWQGVVGEIRQRLLLVRRGTMAHAPVVVLHDATAAGQRALQAAVRICGASQRPLIIAMPKGATETDRAAALAQAHGAGVAVSVASIPALLESASGSPIDLLVIGGNGRADENDLARLLQSSSGAVLIV